MSWEIILLVGFGALGWYWYVGLNTREQAVAVGRRAWNDGKLQFLDDSVALSRTRFARNSSGQLQFLRDYRFEFSDTGNNRRPGVVRMLGDRVEWVSLDGEWQPGHSAGVTRLPD
ncbi:MAG TPA: DUF3301 domain-containing protein [Rhodoferax sp.]|nr:DUF3301 domain-containing protein [Rhodoferax sp.]